MGLIAAVAEGGAAFAFLHRSEPPKTAPAEAATPVVAATVTQRDMPILINALGTVQSIQTVNVQSRVNGQIMQAFFKQGELLKEGDPLFLVDTRPYQAALDQVQAQLEHDQALLAELARYQKLQQENSIAPQQAADQAFVVQQDQGTVKLDQANVETAKLNLDYAHINSL
jgi:membrane fusion protein, multidrug efflux system